MKQENFNLTIIISVLLLIFIGGFGLAYGLKEPINNLGTISYTQIPINGNSSTSSTTYLKADGVATTSYAGLDISRADEIDLNLYADASSTASQLEFWLEFSYDGIDYYREDINSVSGSVITHNDGNSTTTRKWAIGASGIHRKNIGPINVNAKYMKVMVGATGDNLAFWGEIIANKPY